MIYFLKTQIIGSIMNMVSLYFKKLVGTNYKKRYILSFLFVSVVPILIIMLLLFTPVTKLFREEIIRYDTSKSRQLRDIMDIRNMEISSIQAQLSLDSRVREFLYSRAPLDHIGNYYVSDVCRVIRSTATGNNFISFIGIYFMNGSMVVTEEGKYDADYFFDNVMILNGTEPSDLKSKVSRTYHSLTLPLAEISGKASINGNYVTYIKSIPIGEPSSAANIIILIDGKNLIANTGEIDFDSMESIIIINSAGEIVFSNGKDYILGEDHISKILNSNSEESPSSFEIETEQDTEAILSFAKSNFNDWTYIVISDTDNIFSKIGNIRNQSILIIMLTLIVTIFLSLLMGDIVYDPWKKLTSYITSAIVNINESREKKIGNDYQFALGSFEKLLSDKLKLQNDIDKNRNILVNQIFMNICMGKNSQAELETVENLLVYKDMIVIIAGFEKHGTLKAAIPVIFARWAAIFLDEVRVFSFTDEKDRVCVIVNTDIKQINTLIEKINFIHSSFATHFNTIIYAGAGSSCTNIEHIKDSYSQARRALDYAYIKGSNTLIFFPEISSQIFSSLNLPVHTGNPLLNSLKVGDYNSCSRLLDEYFENILEKGGSASLSYLYCLFYNFVSVIIKGCEEMNIDIFQVFGKNRESLIDIENYENTKHMIGSIYDMYNTLCDFVRSNKSTQNNSLKVLIEKHIAESYSSSNFSLIELASDLGYSSSYLSRFINQEFNTGFGELLNNIRLEKAKILLEESTDTISRISETVGYTSVNSFIRTFRRITGITPKQYRDLQSIKN